MLKTVSAIATQIISSITGGLVQFTGPAAGTTRVITVPNANATMARTDAAQSFTGDQTLSNGNLVIGTSGKGIDFSATSGAGTSELLSDYEEGDWTPSFFNLTVVGTPTYTGKYTKIGRQVTFVLQIQSTTSTSSNFGTTGFSLPFNPADKSTLSAVQSSAGATYGVGLIFTDGNAYPPTWAANASVTLSGTFFV